MNTIDIKYLLKLAESIRKRIVEIVYYSGGGHIGGDLSEANVLVALYWHCLNVTKENLKDPDRDRFILSKGHSVEALYAVLESKGILSTEMLESYGKFGSALAGHPVKGVPGIEFNTGALGHGLSLGVGTALSAKMDGKSFKTYVLMGDGEQDEGSIYEAAMAASMYKLDNLVAIIDRNKLQISGTTEQVMNLEPLKDRWTSFGWKVLEMDGDDMETIIRTLDSIAYNGEKPYLVISSTTKGKGVSFMENRAEWHHGYPTEDQFKEAIAEVDSRINTLE
jgi:transketolase